MNEDEMIRNLVAMGFSDEEIINIFGGRINENIIAPFRGKEIPQVRGQSIPGLPDVGGSLINPGVAPIDRVNAGLKTPLMPGDVPASTPSSYYEPNLSNIFQEQRNPDTSMDDVPCEKEGQIRYGGVCIDPIELVLDVKI